MKNVDEISQDGALLHRLTQTVLQNLENEQFSVEELSEQVGMSRSHLHRKLKLLKGQSVSQFIREIRLEEAIKLLQNDVATAAEIAYRVGFNSPSYFHKCFHDHFGYPPGEINKHLLEPNNNGGPIPTPEEKSPAPESQPVSKFHDTLPQETPQRKVLSRKLLLPTALVLLLISAALLYYYQTKLKNGTTPLKAIAVLPLDNLTGDPEQEYLAAGLHDALIGELGKISGLRVISKTSALRYSGQPMLMQEIARELKVDVVVEGSVFVSGDSLRLQIQLIQPYPEEHHIFAQEYYQDIRQVLAMQSNVIRDISREIQIKLTPQQEIQLSSTRTVNPETYKNYLRGMYHLNKGTTEDFEKGIAYLNQAIESDPADPFAYAGLAVGYAITGHGPLSKEEAMERAKAAAQRALSLDENMDNAHTALAIINLYQIWDWEKARTSFEDALAINPNNELAHAHFAWLHLLFNNGEEAIQEARLAAQIDPLSPTYAAFAGWIHMRLKDYDLAIAEAKKSLELDPDFPYGHFVLGSSYLFQGRYEEAIQEHQQLPQNNDGYKAFLSITYAYAGQPGKATALLDTLERKSKDAWVHPLVLARLHAVLGNKEEALHYIEEASDQKLYPLPWMWYVQIFEPLKDEPRFQAVFKKWNLPS